MTSGDPEARFDSIEDTIAAFKNGDFIIVLDSPLRENEGDLIIAASALTPAKASFMIRYTSGYICTPMPPHVASSLDLPPMIPPTANADPNRTAYTISVDADHPAITTGISAHDRALTCNLLATRGAKAGDFRRPGHLLPLIAREGGVRERRGHTEAAVEMCRLAGRGEVAAICELVEDGEVVEENGENGSGSGRGKAELVGGGMMRRDGCLKFARRWGLRCCTIDDLVAYLERTEGRGGKGVNGHTA